MPNFPQCISFDVGGTLMEPWPSVGAVYADVARTAGIPIDAVHLNQRFADAWVTARKTPGGFDYSRSAWKRLVQLTFGDALPQARTDDVFEAIWHRFERPEVWKVHGDVFPTLKHLQSRGVRLTVLSNWDERLRPLLRQLGLADFFEDIVVSGEVGLHKPDPALFEYAARRWAVEARSILHVGDSEREDLQGPQKAGWQAVLIDRSDSRRTNSIIQLDELIKWIG
jgi:putative hydrolase of the HAD superfamily